MNSSLSKIINLINTQNFVKAENELSKIYNKFSNSYDVNKLLGIALLAQKKYNNALKCFNKCYLIKKNDYEVLLNLSFLFLKVQFYKEAIQFGKDAITLDSQKPNAYQNLGASYFQMGDFENAKKQILKTIELRGGFKAKEFFLFVDLRRLYGDILLAKNEKKEFLKYAEELLLNVYDSNILAKLLRENVDNINNNHLEAANKNLENSKSLKNIIERNTELSGTHFFFAEYYDKKNKKLSEQHYLKANRIISDMQRESIFNRQKNCFSILKFFKDFDDTIISKSIDPLKGSGLIFIVGLPRSGTSLAESILSTADDITTGGEKTFFTIQLQDVIKNLFSTDTNLSTEFFSSLGDRYLDHIKIQRGNSTFFTDKLPENYLFYQFIKLSLPSAKFIYCHRNPWDNAISLFKQNYAVNIFYASSFFGIANEVANSEHLIKFWKEKNDSNQIFDLEYEQMVSKNTNIIEKVWGHCGLKGKYSESRRKNHFAYTASMQQVTRDIYATSLKKKDFLDQKSQFFEDLENQRIYWLNKVKSI
tara:strand:- start:1104 stop:2705 length:1602 start_codon:yes stop_codon:yes gene_type:complete